MRVSTLQTHHLGVNAILENQSGVQKTQQQISSGRRVLTPADDPVAATKILQLRQDIAQRKQYEQNMNAADNRLKLEDATLKSVNEYVVKVRELTIKAGDASYTQKDRRAIAMELSQIQKALADLFNTRDANEEYIFAGYKGTEPPYVQNRSGRYEFKGDEGNRFLTINTSTTVATGDSGKHIFEDVKATKGTFFMQQSSKNTGNARISAGFVTDQEKYDELKHDDLIITFNPETDATPPTRNYTVRRASDNRIVDGLKNMPYTDGKNIEAAGISFAIYEDPKPGDRFIAKSSSKQSLSDTVHRLMDGLNRLTDSPKDRETLNKLLADTNKNILNAQASVSETRSQVGARLNVVQRNRDLSADVKLVNKGVLSKLADVDFAEAVSRLTLQVTLLEAAQKSYGTISRLSLFNEL